MPLLEGLDGSKGASKFFGSRPVILAPKPSTPPRVILPPRRKQEATTFRHQNIDPFGGLSNPYGTGLGAWEPDTEIYEPPDETDIPEVDPGVENPMLQGYDDAYNAVQRSKAEEAAKKAAASQFTQFSAAPAGGAVNSVPYASLFNEIGQRYGIAPALLAAVAKAESGFNASARSPAGAMGLMQFMPGTAAGMGVNALDPRSAVEGAARYLKSNLQRFGSVDLALAAYNAGPGNVSKYGGIPPFAETQAYVPRVLGYMKSFGGTSLTSGTVAHYATAEHKLSSKLNASGTASVAGVIAAAKSALGRPYVWGGTNLSSGVDCSGLIFAAFRAAGVNMPRYRASDYGKLGAKVNGSDARAGDLVYWDQPGGTDHVGIYLGGGKVIQAPQSGDVVKVSNVWDGAQYRRVFDDGAFGQMADQTGNPVLSYAGHAADAFFGGLAGLAGGVSVSSPVSIPLRG